MGQYGEIETATRYISISFFYPTIITVVIDVCCFDFFAVCVAQQTRKMQQLWRKRQARNVKFNDEQKLVMNRVKTKMAFETIGGN